MKSWREKLKLTFLEWTYGRVSLDADFIYHPFEELTPGKDPLDWYWTFGWKFTVAKFGWGYREYGDYIKGTDRLSVDPHLLAILSEELTQAVNVAYQLGREDGNIVLRLWRRWRWRRSHGGRPREGNVGE